eukprot:84509_1
MAVLGSNKWKELVSHVIILWLILAPYCLWCTIKYYRCRHHIVISKRYPTLTILFCIVAVMMLCIEQVLYRIIFTFSNDYDNFSDIPPVLFHITIIFSTLLQTPIPWLMATRFWLIYYNVQWTKSTLNKQWKIHLNYLEIDQNWFLSHKSTVGNAKYLTLRVLIIVFCLSIFSIFIRAASIAEGSINGAFSLFISAFLPFLFMIIISCKMRKFTDYFYIIKEFKAITICIYANIAAYIIFRGILPQIFGWNGYIKELIVSILMAIQVPMFVTVQTIYVLHNMGINDHSSNVGKFQRLNSNKIDLVLSEILSSNTSTKTQSETDGKSNEEQTVSAITIDDTLSKESTFEAFMLHLSKEWSMELLLAYVEVTQLQQQIKLEYSDFINDMEFRVLQESLLTNNSIPLSFIISHTNINELVEKQGIVINRVHDKTDKMIQFKIRMYALYLKYIKDSELQINISYQQHKKLASMMQDVDYFI